MMQKKRGAWEGKKVWCRAKSKAERRRANNETEATDTRPHRRDVGTGRWQRQSQLHYRGVCGGGRRNTPVITGDGINFRISTVDTGTLKLLIIFIIIKAQFNRDFYLQNSLE
jgi:hypothetical protein